MFSIFKKKNIVSDIEWLGVDIHSHLLPGIDDGSPNTDESVKLIEGLHGLGLSNFICTPHIFPELYPNSKATILPALAATKEALKNHNISVNISAAAEYMIDNMFKSENELMVISGNYILIEMSYLNETPNIDSVIFDLQIKGYNVILAHPERYIYYHNNKERLKKFKDMGVLFQLNILSIVGYYGKDVKLAAESLLANRSIDLAGSDLHHSRHLQVLTKFVKNGEIFNKIGNYPFKNMELTT